LELLRLGMSAPHGAERIAVGGQQAKHQVLGADKILAQLPGKALSGIQRLAQGLSQILMHRSRCRSGRQFLSPSSLAAITAGFTLLAANLSPPSGLTHF
jgi:hypothetical protein